MINSIPIIGWILSLLFHASLAVPFWICWTVFEIGPTYFYWLPDTYHTIPFGHCVALFLCITVLKSVLIPKLVSVSQDARTPD